MTIGVTCNCGKRYTVKETHAGKMVRCSSCQGVILVPSVHTAPPNSAPDTYALARSPEDATQSASSQVDVAKDAILGERSRNTMQLFRDYRAWHKAAKAADKNGDYLAMDGTDAVAFLGSMPAAALSMGLGHKKYEKSLERNRKTKRENYQQSLPGYSAVQELRERGYPVESFAIMKTLATHIGNEDVNALAHLARNSSDKILRQGAVVALADVAGAASDRISLILASFQDDDPSHVWYCSAKPLAAIVTAIPSTMQRLVDVTANHPLSKARIAALGALRILGPDAAPAIEVIVQSIDDPDSSLSDVAVRTLCSIGPTAAPVIPNVIRAMLSKEMTHLDRLSNIEDPRERILPALIAALESSDNDTQLRSLKAISQFGKLARPAIPSISRLCVSPRDEIAKAAYQTLMSIDVRAAVLRGGPQATAARIMIACFVVVYCALMGFLIWRFTIPALMENNP